MTRSTAARSRALAGLPPVAGTLEVEEQMQDAALKGTPEAVLTRVVPLLAHDAECDVLVWGARLHTGCGVGASTRVHMT